MSDNQAKEHFTSQQNQIGQIIISLIIRYLSATRKPDSLCPTSAEGASCFCQTMPPSGRQLMSIGASEHRAFVRAKARFAGQRLRNTVLSVEMLLHRTYCRVSLVAFSGGKCRACLALPDVPASDLPVLIHSRWKTPPARPSAASVAARCEPILAFPLLPGPPTSPAWPSAAPVASRCEPIPVFPLLPGPPTCPAWPSAVSVSARCEPIPVFPLPPGPSTCPAWPSAASVSARCEPISAFPLLPGPSTCPAWPFAASVAARCEPILAFPLLPGPSTHPAWLFAASAAARCEPFSLNRLIPAPCYSGSWPGTMAAGAGNRLPPAMLLC